MRALFSVLLLISLMLPGYGQSDHLEQFMDSLISRGPIPGMHLVVYHRGKEVYDKAHGYSKPEIGELLDGKAIYRLHSMTKPIISVGVLKLVAEGHLDLDDPIHFYLPEFRRPQHFMQGDSLQMTSKPILVKHLLTHQSGLGYGFDRTSTDSIYRSSNLFESRDLKDFTRRAAALPLYEEPGTTWRYGINHTLAGRLIEIVSGQDLQGYLRKEIFEPLAMNSIDFQIDESKRDMVVPQYLLSEGTIIPDPRPESQVPYHVTFYNGGGGLYGTTSDYLKFAQMLLQQGKYGGEQIIPDSAILELQQDYLNNKKWHKAARGPGLAWYGGFGMGVAVTNHRKDAHNPAPMGSYGWGGAAGTFFHVDPKNELIIVGMTQVFPATAYEHIRNTILSKIYFLLPALSTTGSN